MHTETAFRALGDSTRLRILQLAGAMELAVGEIAQVTGQSQPRVSRHIGVLVEAGLLERRREGSWIFLRAGTSPLAETLIAALARAAALDPALSEVCAADRRRLGEIRAAREADAEAYFAARAEDWDAVRRLHSPDASIEAALAEALGEGHLGELLDIGTGTGRMAELLARRAARVTALDKNLAMLRVARARLQHLPAGQVELVQGDFAHLPFADAAFDTVVFHQVLHFAADPATALAEAGRVTRPGGRIAIVDFAAHQREELRERHAHARLGFADPQMAGLLARAGFTPAAPRSLDDGELAVKIWVAQRSDTPAGKAVS